MLGELHKQDISVSFFIMLQYTVIRGWLTPQPAPKAEKNPLRYTVIQLMLCINLTAFPISTKENQACLLFEEKARL